MNTADLDPLAFLAAMWARTPEQVAADTKAAEAVIKAEKAARPVVKHCPRCSGSGKLPEFRHVAAGECFRCNGTGLVD